MRQVPAVRIARLAEGTRLSRGGVSSLLQLRESVFFTVPDESQLCGCM